MQIRRPVAALLATLALTGAGALTACGAAEPARTGTPMDDARLTTGAEPTSDRQGNLPTLSNRQLGSGRTKGGVGGGAGQNEGSGG